MEHVQVLLVDVHRRRIAERVEEVDLRAGPRRLLAPILVGKQVDVIAVRVGRLREPVQPFVDVADQRVDVAVARRAGRRDERHVERLIETARGGERARDAEPRARRVRRLREPIAIRTIGFVEESGRPERIAVERDRFRIGWRELSERLGLASGLAELGHFQRRADAALTGAKGDDRVVGLGGLIERLKGFLVSGFVVEQRGELELEVGIGALRASHCQRASDEQRERDQRRLSPTG